jgi:hypothetical protein
MFDFIFAMLELMFGFSEDLQKPRPVPLPAPTPPPRRPGGGD